MMEANYLTILLTPNYEKAIDTPQDIIDRGLQVIWTPGSESTVEIWKNSPFYITRALAESAIVPEVIFFYIGKFYFEIKCSRKDWDQSEEWTKNKILQSGNAVVEAAFMYGYELDWAKNYSTRWYRSKDKKGGRYPFSSFMLNKKWTLEEEFTNHMFRFQQVIVSSFYIYSYIFQKITF